MLEHMATSTHTSSTSTSTSIKYYINDTHTLQILIYWKICMHNTCIFIFYIYFYEFILCQKIVMFSTCLLSGELAEVLVYERQQLQCYIKPI